MLFSKESTHQSHHPEDSNESLDKIAEEDADFEAHCKQEEESLAESLLASGTHKHLKIDDARKAAKSSQSLDEESALKELVLNREDGLGVLAVLDPAEAPEAGYDPLLVTPPLGPSPP